MPCFLFIEFKNVRVRLVKQMHFSNIVVMRPNTAEAFKNIQNIGNSTKFRIPAEFYLPEDEKIRVYRIFLLFYVFKGIFLTFFRVFSKKIYQNRFFRNRAYLLE